MVYEIGGFAVRLFPRHPLRAFHTIIGRIGRSNVCGTGFEADAKRATCPANSVGALYILSFAFTTSQKAPPEHHSVYV